ncbi:zinc finger protein 287-like isoform X1 [Spodoptera litura]|uniref:Zinc finger protein 287-like isoform X1 n=1 Tax=Spodoptera litura TaxID=69820 RepID=A0A9J7DYL9_SPOLT|nr:zinc finger protein 287-like isoform X1 [Spodoptera litura]
MSLENWKLEKDLCRCCHNEGTFINLADPFTILGVTETYTNMLKECFDIDLSPIPGMLCASTYTICESCVTRLRDAVDFKKQVLTCEEAFRDLYNRNFIKEAEPIVQVEVKQEIPDANLDDVFKDSCPLDSGNDYVCVDSEDEMELRVDEQDEPSEVDVKSKKRKLRSNKKAQKNKSCRTERKSVKVESEGNSGSKKIGGAYYEIVDEKYRCKECGNTFSSQPLVSQHYRFVHLKRRPRLRKCPYPDCSVKIPANLRTSHLDLEHGVPAPSCGVCGKKFRYPSGVLEHQKKVHMGEKTCVCNLCEKSFFDNHSLKLHMTTHSDLRKFKCDLCGKRFRWENNLKDHVRIHTGDKRFTCPVCGKDFVQKSTLKQHSMRNHPGVDISSSTNVRKNEGVR